MDQQVLQERVGLYSLLRTLYTYPLTEPHLADVAGLAAAPGSPVAAPLEQMQARLHANGAGATTVETLNVEMTRLLEGPGLTPAPPYASYYLYGGQLMGPSAVAAHQIYLKWHVLPDEDVRRPDDHLALELGFLAHLANLAAGADTDTDASTILAASRAFIRQHLMPWLPHFCTALAEASDDPFFVGLAKFTQAAVEADLDWLTAALNETANDAEASTSSQRIDKESST